MTGDLVLDNALLVLPDEVVAGHVVVRDGVIAAVERGRTRAAGALDLERDYLLPGLVELHTDNLEKHVAPRPGVRWPMLGALVAHDAQIAAAGITTVFDALAIVEAVDSPVRSEMLTEALEAIATAQAEGLLRADHLVHLRCEVGYPRAAEVCTALLDGNPLVRLVSLMDHTPGQRQFASVEKYYEFYQGRFGYNADEMRALVDQRIANQADYADRNRRALVAICADRELPIASHDDATAEHVAEAIELGMTISEFPTTLTAARLAHERGMSVIMGAPNIVRGGSHSGNVSALDLAEAGVLDILSSDYVPVSLVHAVFLLHERHGLTLPEAAATVSANPARVMGLGDRGAIAVGKWADLVRVRRAGTLPVVRQVWRAGRMVA